MTPQDFIRKWKAAELTERAAAQEHFLDLCRLFDHPTPASDPTAQQFAFEKGVTKTGGGDGFADVWKRGFFAWEYKKKKRNLDAALEQLSRYAAALEYPPLHVACDIDRIVILTAWTNTVPEGHTIHLDELAAPDNYERLRAIFFDPEKLKPQRTRQAVTAEAATKFVTIAERLQYRVADSDAVAHFVNQLVFCFFAEDVRLLPEGFFTRILDQASKRPERCKDYLDRLFDAMEEGGEFDLTEIRHFNGGLFDGRKSLPLEADEISLLAEAGKLHWDQIDPTIFGTLFERFLDPEKRAQIGAHYTDTEKIMMIVEPVILRPLRREWEEAKAEIATHATAAASLSGRAYANAMNRAEERRAKFLERLRNVSILDPACGSGNFLYLALQGVKDIEHRANLECEALGLKSQAPLVGPEILHGIEINRHAAELARTTIWIGHIQWAIRNGIYAWPSPVLRRLNTIENRDALIERDAESGAWREARWPEAEFIVGNPPFLGGKLMRNGLGDDYVDGLFATYRDRVPPEADLVVYWVVKGHEAIRLERAGRAGLVTTNSIRGGANRQALDAIVSDDLLFEAWSDEPWIVEGAAVRVSIVEFGITGGQKHLNGAPVDAIHADLTSHSANLIGARRLRENSTKSFQGIVKVGAFDIPGATARLWLDLPANPNHRPNSDVVRLWMNGADIVRRPTDTWIIDFGEMTQRDAALYEQPFQWVVEHIKPTRISNRDRQRRENWWRLGRSGSDVKSAISDVRRCIITPRVAKFRLFVWATNALTPDSAIVAIARDDDTTFGILHSRFHEAWSLRLGTSLEDRPRYTPTTTFETFPFPEGLTPDIPAADYAGDPRALRIAAAAKRLDDLRNAWLNPADLVEIVPEVVPGYPDRILPKDEKAAAILKDRTLTKLYNARPQWLADAHAELDRAVAAAYGWPEDIATDDALAKLLELNLARAAEEAGAADAG
jgi:type II restriction/modification system DNA methylase subunit YeeA